MAPVPAAGRFLRLGILGGEELQGNVVRAAKLKDVAIATVLQVRVANALFLRKRHGRFKIGH